MGFSRKVYEVTKGYLLPRLGEDLEVEQVNDPSEVIPACRQAAADETDRPYLVLNGGNKLAPVGLLTAWHHLSPILLYGDERPACYWKFDDVGKKPAGFGRFGRMWLSGSESEIITARDAAVSAIEALEGKAGRA